MKKKILIVSGTIVVLILFVILCVFSYIDIQKNKKYNQAIALYNENKYETAKGIFNELGTYKDSSTYLGKIIFCIENYDQAITLYKDNQYDAAKEIFYNLGDYKECSMYLEKIDSHIKNYDNAVDLYNNGEYYESKKHFAGLKKYKDSENYVLKVDLITLSPQIFSIEDFADELDSDINERFLKAREGGYSPTLYSDLEFACIYAELLLDTQNILIEKLSSYNSTGSLKTYLEDVQKYIEAQKVLNETNIENVRYIFLENGRYTNEENENIRNIKNTNNAIIEDWKSRRDDDRLKMFTDAGFTSEEATSIISQRIDVFSFMNLNIAKNQ